MRKPRQNWRGFFIWPKGFFRVEGLNDERVFIDDVTQDGCRSGAISVRAAGRGLNPSSY
jgi:hypothetical protein